MPIQQWSRDILLVDMRDEPQFSEDLQAVAAQLDQQGYDVVVNLGRITQFNSMSLGQLLNLRQRLVEAGRQLRLCGVPDAVWGMMLVASLDKVFEVSPDPASALTSLQLDASDGEAEEE